LRRQRELRSVTLREISDATKINIRFLEALEENDFKHLPGGQFNKGFIRAYARHIGVDGEDMVNAYILEVRRQEDEAPSGRTSTPRARLDPADRRALIALAGLAAIVVLIALGIWFVFFKGHKVRSTAPQAARAAHGRKSPESSAATGATGEGSAAPASGSSNEPGSPPAGTEGATNATGQSGATPPTADDPSAD